MSYMLPLYLDYLERPHIYEGLIYKKLGIIKGTVTEAAVIRIRNKLDEGVKTYAAKKAAKDAAAAAKRTPVKTVGKKLAPAPKAAISKTPLAKVKLKAAHKVGKVGKVAKKLKTADVDRRVKDAKALGKKIVSTSKKTVAKKPAWSPTAVKAGKTAAQGSEFGATVVKKVAPKTAPKTAGALKGLGKLGAKGAVVGAAAGAAYGGYKLYKRHFSKAAQKCKGKSGAERTLCLQQNTGS